jgi:hypothetical protein
LEFWVGLHIGAAISTAQALKGAVSRRSHINSDRLNPVRPRFVKSNGVTFKLERLELWFFWLVVFWADFESLPVFLQDVIGITLSAVIA